MAGDPSKAVDHLARTTAASVASLSLADITELKAHLDERCDFLLTKLDSFNQLLKAISEQAEFLQMNVPKVIAARENMKQVYSQVDQLENLVSDVRSSLVNMESKVEQAESLFTTSYQQKLFKVFQSALGSSTSSNASGGQYRRQVRFEPPDLFRIEEYFPPPSPGRRLAVSATARSSVDSEARLPELQRSDNSI